MTTAANCNETRARKVVDLPPGAKLSYNVDEAAPALGVSISTIWTMLREGELTAKKIRGRVVIARVELQRIIDEAPDARAA